MRVDRCRCQDSTGVRSAFKSRRGILGPRRAMCPAILGFWRVFGAKPCAQSSPSDSMPPALSMRRANTYCMKKIEAVSCPPPKLSSKSSHSVKNKDGGWWGEGDEILHIGGNHAIQGTGSEDCSCESYGLRRGCFPYYGVTICEGPLATAYRWHAHIG